MREIPVINIVIVIVIVVIVILIIIIFKLLLKKPNSQWGGCTAEFLELKHLIQPLQLQLCLFFSATESTLTHIEEGNCNSKLGEEEVASQVNIFQEKYEVLEEVTFEVPSPTPQGIWADSLI